MLTEHDGYKLIADAKVLDSEVTVDFLAGIIEALIDDSAAVQLITAFVQVCEAKADHLEANWQDKQSAKSWRRLARDMSKINATI